MHLGPHNGAGEAPHARGRCCRTPPSLPGLIVVAIVDSAALAASALLAGGYRASLVMLLLVRIGVVLGETAVGDSVLVDDFGRVDCEHFRRRTAQKAARARLVFVVLAHSAHLLGTADVAGDRSDRHWAMPESNLPRRFRRAGR